MIKTFAPILNSLEHSTHVGETVREKQIKNRFFIANFKHFEEG